ncbi:hypothetical protein [Deinococcus aetherius]|uniref:hypothetical protein n=1 Tax=Deinococcus aetherius TaxID=200252 RepID=UPI002231546A|nr:hypothetical protein [Deinococcus aetherius]
MSDQERIKVGQHIQEVEGLRPGAVRRTVLRGAQLAGLDQYLARAPLKSVRVSGELRDDGGHFTGDHICGTIRISARRVQGEDYGIPFRWGEVATVATSATTPEQAMQRTFVHELGHCLLYRLMEQEGREAVKALIKPVFREAVDMSRTVSERAEENWHEYFCETFSASVYHHRELTSRDPVGYRMVQQARALLEVDHGDS